MAFKLTNTPDTSPRKKVNPVVGCLALIFIAVVLALLVFSLGDDAPAPLPSPTPTGSPSPVPNSQLAPDEQTYITEFLKISQSSSEALSHLGTFVQEKPLPSAWSDTETVRLALDITLVKGAYSDAQKLTPPPRFAEIHALWLSALLKNSEAMDLFTSGVDTLDVEKLNQASAKMTEASAIINQVTVKIRELQ